MKKNAVVEPDQLHRHLKLALDTGEVANLEEARILFDSYRLGIVVGSGIAHSATMQAAVLTAVNTGRRSFLGGVFVEGTLDVPLLVPWGRCRTLEDAVVDLKGVIADCSPEVPRLVIGGDSAPNTDSEFAVRATFDGWRGGVAPLYQDLRLPERRECVPAGVLAGALGVSEAFQFLRRDNALAGRRDIGLSLWQPDRDVSWLKDSGEGPEIERLPASVWLIGLGHLGQAFLWTLGLLPYHSPKDVHLVLQDFDELVEANESTSLLTTRAMLGQKKTRSMALWCESRGFSTSIVERRFADDFKVAGDEPRVALCGVDNALARAYVEDVGFDRVIEAGLGAGTQEYLAFQTHTFPARRSARTRWAAQGHQPDGHTVANNPAYRALAEQGLDDCGVTTLAGRTVGASFVGAVTATVVLAELLRMGLGGHRYEVIDGSLRSLELRQAVEYSDVAPFNPGTTAARLETV
ncbi:MAG: thiamine biosynthesis protein ThiF [Chloroflexi bacterium]|nr:thiamine biosynthesis protein ThiF [Chloroflexota bacterium]MYF79962.1 thiamine biosynthesis protein ThiF [Chloroflexota bacterium]MYK60986.1 thiamine biosynthesis protein ThiF [Chloroflexota bacterium]